MENNLDKNGSLFKLSNLTYSYDNRLTALKDINLSVEPGECLAILGSNGSGKSTLLKLLDGLYFPTRGTISAFGVPLNEEVFKDEGFNAQFRQRVGLVFQDSDVQLFLASVWDEIAFAPLQLGLGKEEVIERVNAALIELDIEKLRERPPYHLSVGEKKRVALASVLSLSPQIWLMDEPSAGLDPRSTRWLKKFLLKQVQDKKTVVLATHDIQLAASIANRTYVLDENHQILIEGEMKEILSNKSVLEAANLI
jgi:cobalt/nickel transport system ATP-binding protein